MYFDVPKTGSLLVYAVRFCAHKGRRTAQRSVRQHRHARYAHEMIYVDYGAMSVAVEDNEVAVRAGECILIPGGKRHVVDIEADTPSHYLDIMFRGAVPEALFGKPLALNQHGLELVKRLSREAEGGLPCQYEALLGCLTELMVHLVRQRPGSASDVPMEPAYLQHHHSEVVARTLAIITNHYADPLTLKRTSRAVGVSPSYLHVLLKRETGKTFTQLLHERRIEMAKHMLQDSSMALKQIIPAVGYKAPPPFFRVFKRLTGMTPAAYARGLGEPTEWRDTTEG